MTALEGPLRAAVIRIAWPAALGYLLIFANNFVDYFWVKLLGTEASAGQTAGWMLFWMVGSFGQIFSVGVTAVVARRVGEGRLEAAASSAAQGMRAALLGSVLVGVAGWMLVPVFVSGNASSPAAAGYTTDYLRTIFAGTPLLFSFYVLEGTFKGHGDTRRPLRAMACALGLNIVLDPILIHVVGLEVLGAALATVIAFGLTGLLLILAAQRRALVAWRAALDVRLMARIVRIGAPISIHGVLFSIVYIFIITEVNLVGGDAGTAALGLGIRIESFGYMVCMGLAAAAAAVVGQNLGAGNIRRANEGAWAAARLGLYINGAWGLLMLVAPRGWVSAVSPGAQATGYSLLYLEIVACSLPFMALELTMEGAFAGAGNTLPPMLMGIPLTVVRIPGAMVVSRVFGWGLPGIFWVLTLTAVARGFFLALWFARGRWIHAKA